MERRRSWLGRALVILVPFAVGWGWGYRCGVDAVRAQRDRVEARLDHAAEALAGLRELSRAGRLQVDGMPLAPVVPIGLDGGVCGGTP